jgi:subtilisin family serine protease
MAIPERLYAHASPLSIGRRPLFEKGRRITRRTVRAFRSLPSVVRAARARLAQAGFDVWQATPLTVNFSGPTELFEKAFRTKIVEKQVRRSVGESMTTLFDSPDSDVLGLIPTEGTPFANLIEGVALEVPRYFFAPSATPPQVEYFRLNVPADIASHTRADVSHALGVTGQGVRVAFVDSGWYRHPYFEARGYNVAPVVLAPGASAPEHDESGHGTGESANLLAIAPGCQLLPIKMNFVNTIAAFNAAVFLQPDIISCSWGSHSPFELSAADMALSASVAEAISAGIIVVFAAGNGHAGFPGQHPDVISAGGTFVDENGTMRASDYASAFMSQIFADRRVPDLCGLVGMRPKAAYIMLPVEPGDSIDSGNVGVFPAGDGTEPDDGWAAFSGTSAACPQIAGVAALIKQVAPSLPPLGIKFALMSTGRDVTEGSCNQVGDLHGGLPTALGPDDATGWGLVDAFEAVVTGYLLGQQFELPMPIPSAQPVTVPSMHGIVSGARLSPRPFGYAV